MASKTRQAAAPLLAAVCLAGAAGCVSAPIEWRTRAGEPAEPATPTEVVGPDGLTLRTSPVSEVQSEPLDPPVTTPDE